MKERFFERIGQWITPPCIRKSLTSLKALTLLFVMGLSVNVWGADLTPSFSFTSCPSGWPSGSGVTAGTTKTYTVGSGDSYTFTLGTNVYYNTSKYLMLKSTTYLGLPAVNGYKLTGVSITNSSGCSTKTKVAVTTTSGGTTDVTGGTAQTFSTTSKTYSYTLSNTTANTSYYLYITSANCQIVTIALTYTAGTPSGKDVSIDAEDELELTAEESDGTITITYGDDVADKEINLFSDASCTTPFSGDWFEAELNSTTGNIDYVADANTGAAREAYIQIYVLADDATDNTKVIKVTQAKYAAPTGTFEKYVGDLVEGDYVICDGTEAMNNTTTTAPRINYQAVTISNNQIDNPDEAVIWHIAVSGDYWTMYNAAVEKYAAFTSSDGKGTLLDEITDYALWQYSVVGSNNEFSNKGKTSKYLRKNSTFGFASYGTGTGKALTLYKKSNGLETVATPTFSPAAGLYEAEQDITISCTTAGASIYYTTDGTVPSTSSTLYTGTFKLDKNKTIKAIAVKEGMNNSSVASATYTFALPYTSLAEFVSAAPTTESALVLEAADGVVIIGATAKNLYVQDAAGTTMILYNSSAAPAWTAGKRIEGKLTGTFTTYQGMNEMVLISWNNANADNDGTMPEPVVLTELTESTFATNFGKYIKMEGQYFQSTGLSSNAVDTKNAGQTITSKMYNTFGVMTGKTLPANDDATVVEGVFIKYNSDYELAVTSIAAGDAKIDVDPVGGADAVNAVALAMNAQVTVTPVAGFATKLNGNPITEATTITIDEAKSITVVSNRDFYTEKSVTYFYKVDESAKAVTVNQPEVGGTIAANPVSGAASDIITLTYEAAAHYNFGSFSVMAGETPITVSENEGVYTFEMPNANVTVSATFNIMSQYTATFVAGAATATGSVDPIARYMDELEFQLPANGFSYAGHVFVGWSDGSTVKQPGENYTLAGDKEFTATWEELPIWAYTYTSNVTLSTTGGTNAYKEAVKIRVDDELTQFDALRGAKSGGTGVVKVTVPAHTSALHFHMAGWKDVSGDVTIKKGEESLRVITLVADAGITGSSPYTLSSADPAVDYYYNIPIADSETTTDITFNSASGKRFALFGVNAIQPAAITIDPTSKDFGEVKQDFDAEQVFTLTPNAFATGTITAEIEGEGFSASSVEDNQVTVTFAPTEITDYSATLIIKHDDEQMCTATLSGKGVAATTPEIAVSTDEIDFGKVKQDATIAETVTVTLSNLDAATAAIDNTTDFAIDKTALVTGENTITVSATASSMGEKSATITITGTGATTKTIAVKMDVTSKWAGEYTSNVEVGNDKVIIAEEEYEAIKTGSGSSQGSTTITIPEGAYALHFHAAGWNSEDVTLAVKNGDAELGSFSLYKDAGVKGSGPSYTLEGENYDTKQYFHVEFDALEEETTFTFAATSGNRFVLYGVNQEGAAVEVLQSIEIQGTATALNYEIDQTFVPTGLKVVGTFQKGEKEPTTRDLSSSEFDWSFNPATFTSTEQTSVVVTATAKENTEITASKTIENIVVTAPVVEISTTSTKVDFGTVLKDATVDNKLVYVTFKNCTEASVALSGDDAAKFTIDAEKVEAGDFNWVTVGVADGTTATTGEYAATLTIHAEGAIADIVLPVTLFVEAPDVCDGTDDFETVAAVTSYGARTTTAGWTATNSRVDVVDDYTYFTINGKTSASGVITSPVLEGGIASLKLRYGHLVANETNGVSFRVDIKQDEEVVKTYTITKPNDQVVRDEVYTEMISDVNVAGTFQIVITNLCPSQSTSNKDRVAIGRLCWTNYEAPVEPDFVLENKAAGALATICLPKKIASVENATLFSISHGNTQQIEFVEVNDFSEELAGMPYLVEVTEAGSVKFFTEGEAVLEPVPASEAKGFVGSLQEEKQEVPSNGTAILISGGQLHTAGANCWLTKNHAYIDATVLPSEAPAVSAPGRRLVLTNNEAYVVTGLNAAELHNAGTHKFIKNNRLVIMRDAKLYNAQGQMMK